MKGCGSRATWLWHNPFVLRPHSLNRAYVTHMRTNMHNLVRILLQQRAALRSAAPAHIYQLTSGFHKSTFSRPLKHSQPPVFTPHNFLFIPLQGVCIKCRFSGKSCRSWGKLKIAFGFCLNVHEEWHARRLPHTRALMENELDVIWGKILPQVQLQQFKMCYWALFTTQWISDK